uniref:Salivary lipocalin n=1 Tax=Ixodes ricinus TaxID=34613 RepID=V5HBI8_IXORI
MGGTARCVSVLMLTSRPFESSITAQIQIKQNRHTDPSRNEVVKMTAYTPQSGIKYMIRTTNPETAELLYNQRLVFTDQLSCRVLVQEINGEKQCQLWVTHRRGGSVPKSCQTAYHEQCSAKIKIYDAECVNN